jgi:orotate phosphoribosyltransferase
MSNQIEGVVESGQSVVVVEDLVSTGQSSLAAVQALRDAGCNVKGMVAIFTYGLESAAKNFKEENASCIRLLIMTILIKYAFDMKYIKESDKLSLVRWRENPEGWGK